MYVYVYVYVCTYMHAVALLSCPDPPTRGWGRDETNHAYSRFGLILIPRGWCLGTDIYM